MAYASSTGERKVSRTMLKFSAYILIRAIMDGYQVWREIPGAVILAH
jgi:hypothetical protein